ncbi:MAG TPA: hypothetical protein VN829_21020 [Dongiaceae bacterium]|nr:hypothetical protein [Dongiaceae bacterium]
MRRNRIWLGFGRTAKAVTAALTLVLVLVLWIFAASPSLHQRLHADSNHPDHFCIIRALASGHLNVGEKSPAVATGAGCLVCGVLGTETPLVSLFDFSFSASRAPPRF